MVQYVTCRVQVGVDATAARSCFLMLKIVLRTSGAGVVFSGASLKVQALLRSHGVITDNDPVFNRCVPASYDITTRMEGCCASAVFALFQLRGCPLPPSRLLQSHLVPVLYTEVSV